MPRHGGSTRRTQRNKHQGHPDAPPRTHRPQDREARQGPWWRRLGKVGRLMLGLGRKNSPPPQQKPQNPKAPKGGSKGGNTGGRTGKPK